MPVADATQGIQINIADFKEMIQQVVFAASSDEARPILTGVLITLKDDKIVLAAADGFRFSVRKSELSSPVPRSINAVIPARALSELARVAMDGDQVITLIIPPWPGSGDLPPQGYRACLPADRRQLPGLRADYPAPRTARGLCFPPQTF